MAQEDQLHWRETFFIFFEARNRPTLVQLERAIKALGQWYQLSQALADDRGFLESLVVSSPDDRVTLEISYEFGEAVRSQVSELVPDLVKEAQPDQLALLRRADARLDIMHFELLGTYDGESDDEEDLEDETFDPSCLLMVVQALVGLTQGVPIDPASGGILP